MAAASRPIQVTGRSIRAAGRPIRATVIAAVAAAPAVRFRLPVLSGPPPSRLSVAAPAIQLRPPPQPSNAAGPLLAVRHPRPGSKPAYTGKPARTNPLLIAAALSPLAAAVARCRLSVSPPVMQRQWRRLAGEAKLRANSAGARAGWTTRS
nr:uncharacterized protein LOC127340440 [Lolium perenne]